jgi:hypothetical protein
MTTDLVKKDCQEIKDKCFDSGQEPVELDFVNTAMNLWAEK